MSHSVKNINDKLVEQMLRFLWRQWSAVGVAGTEEINDHRIIDPEALLLVSTEFARHDARLFDEILDWLFQYGQRINLKRIFRIRKQYPLGNSEVLLAISSKLCARSSHIKWRSVTEKSLNKKNDGDGPDTNDCDASQNRHDYLVSYPLPCARFLQPELLHRFAE